MCAIGEKIIMTTKGRRMVVFDTREEYDKLKKEFGG